ncbi:phosphoribosylformylglycinamidine cyclo-ligase [Salirhabdus salicampi]|uniref:phosphoribosylformylglycinamidine cyclo-ligase n=1 Tax=Salirhabdus salicampi TaxID=476102 RepID=UPI0020C382F5|nr:phosphoribosylformylglycinamidine cyclo-ligase [Salirhabdus salicampi]MCP8618004.1 phosphoribosylformylglycinamidine cyclo-ligase [Salirhabdus salicampi]
MGNTYKKAGVDIEAGYQSVERIKNLTNRTKRPEVMGSLGSFGAMFDFSKLQLKEPVLVSGTDGVGTKLMLAIQLNKHDTIGIDAVAMCVNDIVVQGAEPLYFLDYLALGKVEPEKIEQIVSGVVAGCEQAGCSLIGGETAEMPDMYDENDYDIAGFSVGAVEKSDIITGERIEEGDVLIGLRSNGIHSNGFSLVRKVLLEQGSMSLSEFHPLLEKTLGEELLEPTRIYVQPLLKLLKSYDIKGMAHITGGGFIENIPRMLPKLGAELISGSWDIPPIFDLIQQTGNISVEEMYSVFNMGIGMVLAVSPSIADKVLEDATSFGETAYKIGTVTSGSGVRFV